MVILCDRFNLPEDIFDILFATKQQKIVGKLLVNELKEKAIETRHSTAKQAATLAKNTNVKNLILTHFSARYKDETLHLQEAKQIHDSVITARDFLEVEIK